MLGLEARWAASRPHTLLWMAAQGCLPDVAGVARVVAVAGSSSAPAGVSGAGAAGVVPGRTTNETIVVPPVAGGAPAHRAGASPGQERRCAHTRPRGDGPVARAEGLCPCY